MSGSDANRDHTSLSYRDAGVDIDAGDALVRNISPLAKATHRAGVLAGLGGFGSLFELPAGYQEPVLVAGTDGVGTKLRLALDHDRHDLIGIDLVAMCVNDLIVQGAEPLFFLDYYATGHLRVELATRVVGGIAEGCRLAGCALVGGETAEMPGMYHDEDYDLAGFCVGIVEKSRIIDGRHVEIGDVVLGLASSGPHSNGYSLIRKVIERDPEALHRALPGQTEGTLLDSLMRPTRIYVKSLLTLIRQQRVHAMAHITGGGLLENLPRVLPEGAGIALDAASWQQPAVFDWLEHTGRIARTEMLRTFNCGIGMAVIVPENEAAQAEVCLREAGENVCRIGRVVAREAGQAVVSVI